MTSHLRAVSRDDVDPSTSVLQIGGDVHAPVGTAWPTCSTHATPLRAIGWLDMAVLDEGSDERVLLFQCQVDPGLCEDWDATSGSNAALRVPVDAPRLVPPPAPTAVPFPGDPSEPELVELTLPDPVVLVGGGDPETPDGQLGGDPDWIQGEEVPDCVEHGPMRFLASLDQVHPDLNFGGGGLAYVFACAGCGRAAWCWQC